MRELPSQQLNPKIKNVWRINDAIWITIVFLCCFVPCAIAQAIAPSSWLLVALAVIAALYALALVLFLALLPPIRYARWRYELSADYLDIARGIVWRKRFIVPFIRVQAFERDGCHGGRRARNPRLGNFRCRRASRPCGRIRAHRPRGRVGHGRNERSADGGADGRSSWCFRRGSHCGSRQCADGVGAG